MIPNVIFGSNPLVGWHIIEEFNFFVDWLEVITSLLESGNQCIQIHCYSEASYRNLIVRQSTVPCNQPTRLSEQKEEEYATYPPSQIFFAIAANMEVEHFVSV